MSREIKFRVWDGKEMLYPGNERVFDYHAYVDNPIMQYTGLKDAEGQDIYEGDVLEWGYSIDTGHTDPHVEKRTKTLVIETMEDAWKKSRRFVGQPYHGTVEQWESQVRVIGNIYENPELKDD